MKQPLEFLTFFVLIIFLFAGCSEKNSLSTPEILLEDILRSLNDDRERQVSNLIDLIDPEKSYYLAIKAKSIGRLDAAILLGRHSWQNSTGLIKERAAELSVNVAREMKAWADVEFLASIAAGEFPDIYFFRRAVVEAVYRQKKYFRLAEEISNLKTFPEVLEDYELGLFEAVSAYHLKEYGWEEPWIAFFIRTPPSEFLSRAWDFIIASEEDPLGFFESSVDLIEGKYLAATGHRREALPYLEAWLSGVVVSELSVDERASVTKVLENLYINTGSSLRGARFFEALASSKTKINSGAADDGYLFAAARLYRRVGYYSNAMRCMSIIFETTDVQITDRRLWYWFDLLVKTDAPSAAGELNYLVDAWADPDYFLDVLDRLCTSLVRGRNWSLIRNAAEKLQVSGPEEAADRFSYISSRAAELGLTEYAGGGPYSTLYYRILTGDELNELEGTKHSDSNISELNEHELFIKGFIDFELYDYILSEVSACRENLSEEFLIFTAESLTERGFYLDSIRIMYQYQGQLSAEGLMSLYPPLYRQEIDHAAEANGIPKQLMSAIVWKESGFEHDIVSRAGAVGLSQLMPSTAEDVASRMGVASGDLTNPEYNLMLGSWYLNWLEGYMGNPAEAVLSYNGGPGRVRGWRREFPDFPEDLFYEAVPIPETHDYGKRVLTAAVVYGILYYDIEPAKTLKKIFQEI